MPALLLHISKVGGLSNSNIITNQKKCVAYKPAKNFYVFLLFHIQVQVYGKVSIYQQISEVEPINLPKIH